MDFELSYELRGINVKARKGLLGKTHIKSVKATVLVPRNCNAKEKPERTLLYNVYLFLFIFLALSSRER